MRHVLRIEGMNFEKTIGNTTQLSVFRGTSLALEQTVRTTDTFVEAVAARGISIRPFYSGGSQAAYILDNCTRTDAEAAADTIRAVLSQPIQSDTGKIPCDLMTWAVDVESIDDATSQTSEQEENTDAISAAIERAHLRSRFRQMRAPRYAPLECREFDAALTVPERNQYICPIDPMRPVDVDQVAWAATGQFSSNFSGHASQTPGSAEKVAISKRAHRLLQHGRKAKTGFLRELKELKWLDENKFEFARSFQDLTAEPPKGLTESAKGKMAVFYVDGSGFSDLRRAMGLKDFAAYADKLFLNGLLPGVLDTFRQGVASGLDANRDRFAHLSVENDNPHFRLRFENLFLGGDDWSFVAPGWLSADITTALINALTLFNEAQPDKYRARVRIGCLICPAKTPIRRARGLAAELCDSARSFMAARPTSACVNMELIESVDIPDDHLQAQRERRYGEVLQDDYILSAEQWRPAMTAYGHLASCPNSALYGLINDLTHPEVRTTEAIIEAAQARSPTAKAAFGAICTQAGENDIRLALPGSGPILFRLQRIVDLLGFWGQEPLISEVTA